MGWEKREKVRDYNQRFLTLPDEKFVAVDRNGWGDVQETTVTTRTRRTSHGDLCNSSGYATKPSYAQMYRQKRTEYIYTCMFVYIGG